MEAHRRSAAKAHSRFRVFSARFHPSQLHCWLKSVFARQSQLAGNHLLPAAAVLIFACEPASKCCYTLGSFAWCGADDEQSIEGGMPCPAPIWSGTRTHRGSAEGLASAVRGRRPHPNIWDFENNRWIQDGAMCAAIGPSVIALCRTPGGPGRRANRRWLARLGGDGAEHAGYG